MCQHARLARSAGLSLQPAFSVFAGCFASCTGGAADVGRHASAAHGAAARSAGIVGPIVAARGASASVVAAAFVLSDACVVLVVFESPDRHQAVPGEFPNRRFMSLGVVGRKKHILKWIGFRLRFGVSDGGCGCSGRGDWLFTVNA